MQDGLSVARGERSTVRFREALSRKPVPLAGTGLRPESKHHRCLDRRSVKAPRTAAGQTAGWRGGQRRADLVAGHAVDALADQIGVPVVARVLLDHVQVDPPDVAIGTAPPK